MRGKDYEKYLKSPQWENKRQRWFSTYGKRCRGCGKISGPLHLHHLTYERFGNELLSDLVALCPSCHREVEKLHWKMGRRRDRREVLKVFIAANLKRR